ncbi:formate dehydrogenase accessory sulfurtransferase FdhD [Dermabacteraceae bacterium P7074]
MGRITQSRKITSVRIRDGRLYHAEKPDLVAVEEPLDVRLNGKELTLTMRTPGNDVELVHGFLHAEGLIRSREDVLEARYCDGAVVEDDSGFARNTYNVMNVKTRDARVMPLAIRQFTQTSACGVCGKASIDAVVTKGRFQIADDWRVDPATIFRAVSQISSGQQVFSKTGGVHAAALATRDGRVLVVREDVGRHNAVDKVIGWAIAEDLLPLSEHMLIVSSRASFEITQKAYMAGIPLLVCVSAPSSLALDTAERVGMSVCAFTRVAGEGDAAKKRGRDAPGDGRMNVYTHPQRLDLSGSES